MGSTWGQPGVSLGQPGVNLGSTLVNLGSTWGQPGVNLGSTWGQPGVNLGQPWVKLRSTSVNLGSTWVNLHHPAVRHRGFWKHGNHARSHPAVQRPHSFGGHHQLERADHATGVAADANVIVGVQARGRVVHYSTFGSAQLRDREREGSACILRHWLGFRPGPAF